MHPLLGPDFQGEVMVLCLAGVGDTLMTLPALDALHKALPKARITVIAMLEGAWEVLCGHAAINELIHFDFQRAGAWRSLQFLQRMRRRRPLVALLSYPSNRLEYNLILWLLGAQWRIGHHYRNLNMACGNRLKNRTLLEEDHLSNIEENLRLVALLTGQHFPTAAPQIFLETAHQQFALRWLKTNGLSKRRLIGFHPGCDTRKNHARRRWPVENFISLGRQILAEQDAILLVFGGPTETTIKTAIAEALGPQCHVVSTQQLRDTAALIRHCAHFVSNDSGLMHLAGALGVPTTAIFGPTSALWLRSPGSVRNEVSLGLPCQPCFYYSPRHLNCKFGDYRCINGIDTNMVYSRMNSG